MGAVLPNSYVQGFLTASLYQGSLKSVCSPLLNCYACPSALFSCPIGTLQHFMVTGNVPYYGLGTLSVVGATVGRMTCGTLCPFGFLQDLLYKFRAWKVSIPVWTRYFRYAVLVGLVFLIPYLTHENWFSKLCPMGTLIGGLPWVTLNAERPLDDPRAVLGQDRDPALLRHHLHDGEAPVLPRRLPAGGDLLPVQQVELPAARVEPRHLHEVREVPEDLPGGHPPRPEPDEPGLPAVPRLHPVPEPQAHHGVPPAPFDAPRYPAGRGHRGGLPQDPPPDAAGGSGLSVAVSAELPLLQDVAHHRRRAGGRLRDLFLPHLPDPVGTGVDRHQDPGDPAHPRLEEHDPDRHGVRPHGVARVDLPDGRRLARRGEAAGLQRGGEDPVLRETGRGRAT